MLKHIKHLAEILLSEAGGVDVDITEPVPSRKSEITDDDEEDKEEDKSEDLFNKTVHDGKVATSVNKFDQNNPITNLKNNANLRKARIKSQLPQARLKKKISTLIRRRKVDHDR